MKEKDTKVYICAIQGANIVKVGFSNRPEQRLKDFSTGCPYEICLLGVSDMLMRHDAQNLERQLHEVLSSFSLKGEWFRVSDSIFDALKRKPIDDKLPKTIISLIKKDRRQEIRGSEDQSIESSKQRVKIALQDPSILSCFNELDKRLKKLGA